MGQCCATEKNPQLRMQTDVVVIGTSFDDKTLIAIIKA
jgi:hypothetical protein